MSYSKYLSTFSRWMKPDPCTISAITLAKRGILLDDSSNNLICGHCTSPLSLENALDHQCENKLETDCQAIVHESDFNENKKMDVDVLDHAAVQVKVDNLPNSNINQIDIRPPMETLTQKSIGVQADVDGSSMLLTKKNLPQAQNTKSSKKRKRELIEKRRSRMIEPEIYHQQELLTQNIELARTLQEDNSRYEKQRQCLVCIDRAINTVILPCGHVCTCDYCATNLYKCPVCRTEILNITKIYFP